MKITPAKKQDLHAIIGMIDSEFPYKGMTKAIVNGISVLSEYRRKAMGEKLMQYAIKFLRKKKVKEILLLVKVGNFPAKKLYRKVGFRFNRYFDKKIDNSIVEEMQFLIDDPENQ